MSSQAAHNFGLALVELAKERNILTPIKEAADQLSDGLKTPEVNSFLSHPKIPNSSKKELLQRLIPEQTPQEFVNFLNLIVDRHREEILGAVLEVISDLTIEAWGYQTLELISACDLTEKEQLAITNSLAKTWGAKVYLKYRINPNLIGGIIIRQGDRMIDGSLSGQIKALKNLMLEGTQLPI